MTDRYPYPSEATRKDCLDRLRESNRQLELYNLSLDDAIIQSYVNKAEDDYYREFHLLIEIVKLLN